MITKAQVLRGLVFLRVLDQDNNLSLTNIALVAALVRTLMIPTLSVHDLLVFLGTIASYQAKRLLQPAAPLAANTDTAELQTAVAALQSTVTGLQLGAQLNRR